jgi:hypothetical protein
MIPAICIGVYVVLFLADFALLGYVHRRWPPYYNDNKELGVAACIIAPPIALLWLLGLIIYHRAKGE